MERSVPKISNELIEYFIHKLATNNDSLQIIMGIVEAEANNKTLTKNSLMELTGRGRFKINELVAWLDGMTLLDIEQKGMMYQIGLSENGKDLTEALVSKGFINQ